MAKIRLKKSGFIREGFRYQDLIAIDRLLELYRDPKAYAWISVEAEDSRVDGIDDVVACRSDGLLELTQVKFAVDPSNPASALNWNWLLERKGRGKSKLKRWFETTLRHLDAGTLAIAQLRTDRTPDADFAHSLAGRKIKYEKLSSATRSRLESEVGGEADLRRFFAAFEFSHSEQHIDDLEDQLRRKVLHDTDDAGWALFCKRVASWAVRKGEPGGDGRIRHVHLQQAFSPDRPRPLPQNFLVPSSYEVPDAAFDQMFLARVTGGDGVTVLWGPPGRGKSTYLSHCVDRLDRESILCIRHHYFLSLDDRAQGRFHVQAIARSLEDQLGEYMPAEARRTLDIAAMINGAARTLAQEGRRLVVMIDGLDHVWRDNRDLEHMNELFAGLLPNGENVHLVVGTQKVATDALPTALLQAVPIERWTELPSMSVEAVRSWTRSQDEAGRLRLREMPNREVERRSVADALHSISSGLPLHLIYSFESLVRSGDEVDPAVVKALPTCPTGDIRDYYRRFVERATEGAKRTLHLLAGLHFGPPRAGFAHIVADTRPADLIAEVSHLLEFREADVTAFHGSLFAFMRELDDHDAVFAEQVELVVEWLRDTAPPYWRDAWLWVTQAQAGEPKDLIERPDRSWTIEFLAKGYPIEQLISILGHAEQAAFDALDLPSLLRLRSAKIRALNGPEFQTQDWHLLPELAISLTDDPIPLALHRTVLRDAPTALLPFLVEASVPEVRPRFAERVVEEIRERFARGPKEDVHDPGHSQELADAFARTVVHIDARKRRLVEWTERNGIIDATMTQYARTANRIGERSKVLDVAEEVEGASFDRELFTALALEGLGPGKRANVKGSEHPPTRVLAVLKGENPAGQHRRNDLTKAIDGGPDPGDPWSAPIGPILRKAYFDSLAARLDGRRQEPWSSYSANPKTEHVAEALLALESLADFVATSWTEGKRWPTLAEFFDALDLEEPERRTFHMERQFVGVRSALAEIAVDHVLLGLAVDASRTIGPQDLLAVETHAFWNDALWIHVATERRLPIHCRDAARVIVEREKARLEETRQETNESTDEATKLALFASDNGLTDLGRQLLERALGFLLGYGWRKDPFAYEALSTLEMLIARGDADAGRWLLEIAPVIDAILDFTDGKGTRGARSSLHELVLKADPDRAAACLETLIEDDDWHYASELLESVPREEMGADRGGQELLASFVTPSERRALLRSTKGRPVNRAPLLAAQRTTGVTMADERERDRRERKEDSGTPMPKERRSPPDPLAFPPGQLAAYVAELDARRFWSTSRGHVSGWLEAWADRDRVGEALDDLWSFTAGTRLDLHIGEALDVAAGMALEHRGRSEAFEWLVRAQVTRNSWSSHYTSASEATARFAFVAEHFRDKWQEFLRRTSRSALGFRREGGHLSVGYERLVEFLLAVGEVDLAKACTRSIIDILLAETSTMRFPTPDWAG